MLGIRLSRDAEEMLERHARAMGRGKSVIAREWIIERLKRESVDEEMRRASERLAQAATADELSEVDANTDDILRLLDEEDGGYDWGPNGPPA